jgi:hypothetical protein
MRGRLFASHGFTGGGLLLSAVLAMALLASADNLRERE